MSEAINEFQRIFESRESFDEYLLIRSSPFPWKQYKFHDDGLSTDLKLSLPDPEKIADQTFPLLLACYACLERSKEHLGNFENQIISNIDAPGAKSDRLIYYLQKLRLLEGLYTKVFKVHETLGGNSASDYKWIFNRIRLWLENVETAYIEYEEAKFIVGRWDHNDIITTCTEEMLEHMVEIQDTLINVGQTIFDLQLPQLSTKSTFKSIDFNNERFSVSTKKIPTRKWIHISEPIINPLAEILIKHFNNVTLNELVTILSGESISKQAVFVGSAAQFADIFWCLHSDKKLTNQRSRFIDDDKTETSAWIGEFFLYQSKASAKPQNLSPAYLSKFISSNHRVCKNPLSGIDDLINKLSNS